MQFPTNPARMAELKALLDTARDAEDFDPMADNPELEALADEYETLLANSWADADTGLLIGALEYIKDNVDAKYSPQFIERSIGEDEDFLFGEESHQIALFKSKMMVNGRDIELCEVRYQQSRGHYVTINQFYVTISTSEDELPYRIYRPFTNRNGKTIYRLVQEIVVNQIVPMDGGNLLPPAYIGSLLLALETILESAPHSWIEDAGPGDYMDLLTVRALPECRTIAEYDNLAVDGPLADWYIKFASEVLAHQFNNDAWDDFEEFLITGAEELKVLLPTLSERDESVDLAEMLEHRAAPINSKTIGDEIARY